MNTKPAIEEKEHQAVIYDAALRMLDKGYSILPCRGKEPAILKWQWLTTRRPNRLNVDTWYKAGLMQNVGIIGGAVSGGLVIIDLDGWDAVKAFQAKFPALIDTYTVKSGSGKGQHVYLYARDVPPTTRLTGGAVGNIELRADRAYVVAPPSIHPVTGRAYEVSWRQGIARVPHLRPVVEWIKELIAQKHGGQLPPATGVYKPVASAGGWAGAALAGECDIVRQAPMHDRNNTLNRSAFKMGQLVGVGFLSRSEVEQALSGAAAQLAADDGQQSVDRTIKSGLDAGIANPRGKKKAQK